MVSKGTYETGRSIHGAGINGQSRDALANVVLYAKVMEHEIFSKQLQSRS